MALSSSVGLEVGVLVLLEAVLTELGSFELGLSLLDEMLVDRDDTDWTVRPSPWYWGRLKG